MGRKDTELFEMMKRAFGQSDPFLQGEVLEVYKDECTCKVDAAGAVYNNVQLRSIISDDTGMVMFPAIGSKVLCLRMPGSNRLKVVMFETLESWQVKIGESVLTVRGDLISMNGEDYSLVKSEVLKEELDKTHNLLSALLNVLGGAPIPEPGNGAPSALQAALSGAVAALSLGSFNNIANEKIKHS